MICLITQDMFKEGLYFSTSLYCTIVCSLVALPCCLILSRLNLLRLMMIELLDAHSLVDELLDGTPTVCFEQEYPTPVPNGSGSQNGTYGPCETTSLLPQHNKIGNGNGKGDEGGGSGGRANREEADLAKFVKWTVNVNLVIVRRSSLRSISSLC